jgi:pimeloyl-ACP methyl ester carboxylesterase
MTGQWVETPQGAIEVRDVGRGRPVLLVHGLLVDGTFWDDVVERLSDDDGLRLVVPTLPLGAHRRAMRPGTDLTPPGLARILADLVRALGTGPVTVVSADTGTALAQLLLATEPELVQAAVLASGDAYDHFLPPIAKPIRWSAYLPGGLPLLGLAMRRPWLANLPLGFGWLTRRGITREQGRRWSAPILSDRAVRRDARAVLRGIHRRHTNAAAERLRGVAVPVLLAWSDDDRVFPRRLAERLAATLPDARVATVPDSAAFSALDNPDALVGLVREALVSSGLPGGAAGAPHRGSDPAPPARADAP